MRPFDQLDWVHRFQDNYEMVMYLQEDGAESDGIYMQVLRKVEEDGAEAWEIVYDRRLTPTIGDVPVGQESDAYEDEVLRRYLREHPSLVEDEKTYFETWMSARDRGGDDGKEEAES